MDKNVFISGAEIVNIKGMSKLVIKIFDKNNEVGSFCTSLMSRYNAEKYEQEALALLGNKNWFDITYGTLFPQLTMLCDSDNTGEIVGLACKKGLLLKNEVKVFDK
jgi:hypothetical protein